MNIGIFLPNWVGDAVMATPTLRALRARFARPARLVGIMRPLVADVLEGTSWLDDQVLYEPQGSKPEHGTLSVVWRLWQMGLDAAVLLPNSLRSALVAFAAGAGQRVGYARGGRSWLLTHRLEPLKKDGQFVPSPVLDAYLKLANALGAPAGSRAVELATLPADEAAADTAWSALGLWNDRPVVALNSSGAFGEAKLWPGSHFAALARRIAVEAECSVLVLCGPAELDLARQIVVAAAHPRVCSLAEQPVSIGLSKACVRRSKLLVTTDSGPRHFAAAFNVPVITLFGPTHIAWSENHHPRAVHLQLDLDCMPCQQPTCPLGHHRCMQDLTVDQVYRAVEQQLELVQRIPAS